MLWEVPDSVHFVALRKDEDHDVDGEFCLRLLHGQGAPEDAVLVKVHHLDVLFDLASLVFRAAPLLAGQVVHVKVELFLGRLVLFVEEHFEAAVALLESANQVQSTFFVQFAERGAKEVADLVEAVSRVEGDLFND